MSLWAFGFEAIDNGRGEIKTELQAPVISFSDTRSGFPLFLPMWDNTYPYQPMGKIKMKQPLTGHFSICDVILKLKWRHHVASKWIQDFLEAFFMFFQYKMQYLVVSRKKNPLFMWGWDRKIHPSRPPFVITWQAASWCQTVILGTDFPIPPSHSWWILIIYTVFKRRYRILKQNMCTVD